MKCSEKVILHAMRQAHEELTLILNQSDSLSLECSPLREAALFKLSRLIFTLEIYFMDCFEELEGLPIQEAFDRLLQEGIFREEDREIINELCEAQMLFGTREKPSQELRTKHRCSLLDFYLGLEESVVLSIDMWHHFFGDLIIRIAHRNL